MYLKLYIVLHANNILIFAQSSEELQTALQVFKVLKLQLRKKAQMYHR
jgi:hypothetical protein